MAVSEWTKAHAPTDLFRSLLSVIEPQSWPAADDTKARWLALAKVEGRWEVGTERRLALGSRFIDAEQLFSVLMHLAIFGWTSWFAINRVTGTKNDNYDAADILAFLVMAGLVSPVHDWQAAHQATGFAIGTFNRACAERHQRGSLSWDDAVLGYLLERLDRADPHESYGWVHFEEFRGAVAAWRSGDLQTGKAYGGRQDAAPIDVDELFESDAWSNAFNI